jgi:hypothetical protein
LLTSELQNIFSKFTVTVQVNLTVKICRLNSRNGIYVRIGNTQMNPPKQRIKLSLSFEAEWKDYFTEQKTQNLKAENAKSDFEIDRRVNDL